MDQKISLEIPEAGLKQNTSEGPVLSNVLQLVPHQTFYVRVESGAHLNYNIKKGDILIINKGGEPSNNTIVVVASEGELKLNKVSKFQNKLYLMPENQNSKPIEIVDTMDFTIWGIVTHVISPV